MKSTTSSLKRLFRLYRWSRRDPAGFHAHKDDVYLGPKDPDEEIPELHFPSLGPELTVLTQVTQMSRLKALSRASFTVIELQSPVEDVLTPTARITEIWEKLLDDRAHPQRPRTLRSSSHLR